MLSVEPVSDRLLRMRVHHSKSRAGEPVNAFYVPMERDRHSIRFVYAGEAHASDQEAAAGEIETLIREALAEDALTKNDLAEAVRDADPKIAKTAVTRVVNNLVDQGKLRTEHRESNKPGRPATVYCLPREAGATTPEIAADDQVTVDGNRANKGFVE